VSNYEQISKQARLTILDMVYKAQSSHIGSLFSCVEILAALFQKMKEQDQFVLSAGWKAAALYYFLSEKGVIPKEDLLTYNQEGSKLIGLTEPGVPGILFAGGSMQMGVPAAVGFALAKKLKKEKGHVYCLMSDGEMAGGMIWEAAAIASHHELKNLTILVDQNGLQAMGDTNQILNMDSVSAKWRSFNWEVFECDGHDPIDIEMVMAYKTTGPKLILCRTVKGKGWKRAENNNDFHYKNLTPEWYEEAKAELYA